MRRLAAVALALAAAVSLAGCKHHDAGMCDFYQGLGVNWVHMQGYVPSDVQDQIDNYC